ncbi:hypothetical protein DL95DRAFT_472305 [Leptodontidium sp. 2 PMI_412]|nr:hypothetical protein DL95DRAFT_472305 [Leptodontidium sp. 2 PMI_412]
MSTFTGEPYGPAPPVRKIGWMFWGCMSGKYGKGPPWLILVEDNYRVELKFQQDGGAGHNAKATLAYMADRGIVPIFHYPFSPDLSPIEALWDRMKDILAALHPVVHRNSQMQRLES